MGGDTVEETAFGVIVATEVMHTQALTEFAGKLEAQGYESLWLPELFGREPIATAGYLLGQTNRLRVATGIANVYVPRRPRDGAGSADAGRAFRRAIHPWTWCLQRRLEHHPRPRMADAGAENA